MVGKHRPFDLAALQQVAEQFCSENIVITPENTVNEAEFAQIKALLKPIVVAAFNAGAVWAAELTLQQLRDDLLTVAVVQIPHAPGDVN